MTSKFPKQSGQAMVEFALVIGLLMFILTGMLILGFWLSAQQLVTMAAREGSRQAALTLNNELTESTVKNSLKYIDKRGDLTSVVIDPENPWNSSRVRGGFITVSVTYKMPFTFSIFEKHFKNGSPFTVVEASSTSRIECVPKSGRTCPVGLY